ncbi:hypothetical protein C1148_10375 [Clostridium botulinum]|nr:hypothetical protein C1148_10375 [Clostridium botulinum]
MRFKMKPVAILFMALLLSISVPLTAFASTSTKNSLVNVVVSDSDAKTIIAQVPKEHVAEYKEKLKNPDFKQEQINMMNGSTRTLPARALPEGKIITQKYLDRSDVKRAYEAVQPGAFESIIIDLGAGAALGQIMKALNASNAWTLTATVVAWAVEYIRIKPQDWWTQSYIMLLENRISCVRMSHIENLKPTYPAAWLILERL